MLSALALWEGCCKVFLILFTAGVILGAVARPGRESRHVLGQREGLERRKKEVRK